MEESITRETSTYIEDVYVTESIMSSEDVMTKLTQYSLMGKDPDCLRNEASVLGLADFAVDTKMHYPKFP